MHKAYEIHKELFKTTGHNKDVHNTNFFRRYVPTLARNTATDQVIDAKERMYIVDSGALNHREKKTIRQSSQILIFRPPLALWSQIRKQRSTSRSLALTF